MFHRELARFNSPTLTPNAFARSVLSWKKPSHLPITLISPTRALFVCLALLGSAAAICAEAQVPQRDRRLVFGLMLDGYATDHPRGGIAGSGVGIGYEHGISRTASLRAVVSVMSSFAFADDVSICYGTSQGDCMPDAHFAHRLWGLEALALVRPLVKAPIRVIVGPGLLWPVGARVAVSNARSIDTTLGGPRATLRVGTELTLGSSPNAPLLHWSRVAPSARILSMTRFWTVGLVLRP